METATLQLLRIRWSPPGPVGMAAGTATRCDQDAVDVL